MTYEKRVACLDEGRRLDAHDWENGAPGMISPKTVASLRANTDTAGHLNVAAKFRARVLAELYRLLAAQQTAAVVQLPAARPARKYARRKSYRRREFAAQASA